MSDRRVWETPVATLGDAPEVKEGQGRLVASYRVDPEDPHLLYPRKHYHRPLFYFSSLLWSQWGQALVSCFLLGLVTTGIFLYFEMGQNTSTPLSLTLAHWSEVQARAHNLSLSIKKTKWQTLCAAEWPSFKVNWPPEGSFHLSLILQVKSVIYRPRPEGHPDQEPYILVWQDLCENPPSWVKPFLPPAPNLPLPLSLLPANPMVLALTVPIPPAGPTPTPL